MTQAGTWGTVGTQLHSDRGSGGPPGGGRDGAGAGKIQEPPAAGLRSRHVTAPQRKPCLRARTKAAGGFKRLELLSQARRSGPVAEAARRGELRPRRLAPRPEDGDKPSLRGNPAHRGDNVICYLLRASPKDTKTHAHAHLPRVSGTPNSYRDPKKFPLESSV